MVGTPSAWLSCYVSVIECKSVVAVTSMLLSEVIAELCHLRCLALACVLLCCHMCVRHELPNSDICLAWL